MPEYRCNAPVSSVHSLNTRTCARWVYHDGKCAPMLTVLEAMLETADIYWTQIGHWMLYASDDQKALFIKHAYEARVIDPIESV